MSSKKPVTPAPHTITSIYRNTTLGITLQQALEQFTERSSIPVSLHEEILGKFDKLSCEMLSNGRVGSGVGPESTNFGNSSRSNLLSGLGLHGGSIPGVKKEGNNQAASSSGGVKAHGALKYNLLSSQAIALAHPEMKPPPMIPMAPIAQKASFRHGHVEMYRYVNKCYEFIVKDVDLELDVSGRGQNAFGDESQSQHLEEQLATSRYSLSDQTIKLKSEQLKIVAIRTSDLLRQSLEKRNTKKRKREE